MVEQFVAQRTPDHHKSTTTKIRKTEWLSSSSPNERRTISKSSTTKIQKERARSPAGKSGATKVFYKYAPRENNQRIGVVEAAAI
jgi:hypothetical protein